MRRSLFILAVWLPLATSVLANSAASTASTRPMLSTIPGNRRASHSSSGHSTALTGLSISTAQTCCKICHTGKACGNTCISREKICHVGPGCACDG